jgi:hypothetical protein
MVSEIGLGRVGAVAAREWFGSITSCPLAPVRHDEVAFSLLFALDEAACAAAQGGIRTEVGAIYKTTLDRGQEACRARPPDVFHHVGRSGLVGLGPHAHSTNSERKRESPCLVMCPRCCFSPELYSRGTRPR